MSCDTTTKSILYLEFGEWQSSTEQETIEMNDETSLTPRVVELAQSINESEQLSQPREFTDCLDLAVDITDEPPSKNK